MRARTPRDARRVVIKIGSAVLAPAGRPDPDAFGRLAADLARARAAGVELTLVSSGAVASGLGALGLDAMPRTISGKQAAAAVGQPALMRAWSEALAPHAITAAQVLLTGDDLAHRARFLNARRTLGELSARGVIPIINENDSVAFDEIKVGDNDRLSALCATLIGADLLLILSTVQGLYESGRDGQVIPAIDDPAQALAHIRAGTSSTGVGGMVTKVDAARLAAIAGIPTVIAGASLPSVITRVLAGESLGTRFAAAPRGPASRKKWIGLSARVRGSLTVDAGAARAIRDKGASLLPSGVTRVEGKFDRGDAVEIRGPGQEPIARGLSAYAADEVRRIRGERSSRIAIVLGYAYADEVIHRNDLALLSPRGARA